MKGIPEPESTNRSTRKTINTHRGTVVFPPIDDRVSFYTMPEAVKYGNSEQEWFPLLLRFHYDDYNVLRNKETLYGYSCWHPFLSTGGFVSYPTSEEAEAFLRERGYTVESYEKEEEV